MKTRTFKIEDKRSDRLDNLLLQRGQTLEEFLEPWLADADTHMGHNPADDPEDQQAAADRFARKATKAEGERAEAKRIREEQEAAILSDANSGKPVKEGKNG